MPRPLPPEIERVVWGHIHSMRLSPTLRHIERAGPGFFEDMPDLLDDRITWAHHTRFIVEVYGYGRVAEVLAATPPSASCGGES